MSRPASSGIDVTEPRETSRERVLRVATELFATHGYHATGMKDLEKASGLGRSSLYFQFPSKEALLFAIITPYLRELIAFGNELLDTEMPAERRLRELSRGVMQCITENLAATTICFREIHAVTGEHRGELLALHREYEQIWARVLQAGVEEGVFRRADGLAVKALLGMHHYSYLWLRADGSRTPGEIADSFCDLLRDGMLCNPPPR
jgi:TetR/AcrR family transcriptional regulator, cholesterol catabolism regulator